MARIFADRRPARARGIVAGVSGPTRPQPHVGMPVRIQHLGATEAARVEALRDDGRTLVAGGRTFTLRRLNGHFVLDGDPYYGTRLRLGAD
jgi:hypothetical protein